MPLTERSTKAQIKVLINSLPYGNMRRACRKDCIALYLSLRDTLPEEMVHNCVFKFAESHVKCHIAANRIGSWFLDCKFNPKYQFWRNRIMIDYNELFEYGYITASLPKRVRRK